MTVKSIYTKYLFELPIIPQVVSDVLKIPTNLDISSKEVEDILKIDPYLTARLLKIANSSIYSRVREISSVKDAITLIGINKIKALCLLIAGSEIINNKKADFYGNFWNESIFTAFIAKDIAKECGMESIMEDLFTGGIIHNIGEAILYNFSSDKYEVVLSKLTDRSILFNLEKSVFGVDSRTVASEVLNSWEFPKLHVEIVQNYLIPGNHSTFQSILDIISISKLIYQQITDKDNIAKSDLFLTYQSRLNLRKQQVDYYLEEFVKETENNPYFKMCTEALYV